MEHQVIKSSKSKDGLTLGIMIHLGQLDRGMLPLPWKGIRSKMNQPWPSPTPDMCGRAEDPIGRSQKKSYELVTS